MKITEYNILAIEHEIIRDIELSSAIGSETDEEARDLAMYISGVHDMADAVIKAIKELKRN